MTMFPPSMAGVGLCTLGPISFYRRAVLRKSRTALIIYLNSSFLLYEAFEPAEAKRILDRLEFHYTPKHGSWLNMVEIEIGVLNEQCLDRRIPAADVLQSEIDAWQASRNDQKATIDWQFTSQDARNKLERLYPNLSSLPGRGTRLRT